MRNEGLYRRLKSYNEKRGLVPTQENQIRRLNRRTISVSKPRCAARRERSQIKHVRANRDQSYRTGVQPRPEGAVYVAFVFRPANNGPDEDWQYTLTIQTAGNSERKKTEHTHTHTHTRTHTYTRSHTYTHARTHIHMHLSLIHI